MCEISNASLSGGGDQGIDRAKQARFKGLRAEFFRIRAAGFFINNAPAGCSAQCVRRRFKEKRARQAIVYAVERAALTQGDDGCTAGLGLNSDDAEIFALRENYELGPAIERAKFIVADAAKELRVCTCESLEANCIGAIAGDEERLIGELGSGYRKFDVLVTFERPGVEPEILALNARVGRKEIRANGRMNDCGSATVAALDLASSVARIRKKLRHMSGGGAIPRFETLAIETQSHSAKRIAASVRVFLAPDISRGRVAIAEVRDIERRTQPFDCRGTGGNKQIDPFVGVILGEATGKVFNCSGVSREHPSAQVV